MNNHDEGTDSTWAVVGGVALGGIAFVYLASLAPGVLNMQGLAGLLPSMEETQTTSRPFAELLKLVVAALLGIIVTSVHRRYHRDKPIPRSLLQAQVLLCVAGAMVMIIIGSSVARAFGVAGAAGIVRFRTPVEDPKDTTILFLLVALGMACGVGLLEVAGLGAAFMCVVLVVLDRFGEAKARLMVLSVVSATKDFPTEHVNSILRANVDGFETREVLQNEETVTKFLVTMTQHTPIQWLTQELLANGKGVKSVSWAEPSKKG
jgi:uncharacterized membrane protein YhiD involved in acid resistance